MWEWFLKIIRESGPRLSIWLFPTSLIPIVSPSIPGMRPPGNVSVSISKFQSKKKEIKKMSFKDWCICIGASLLTLTLVVLVMEGGKAFVEDTGRNIIHK
jgi:hypothetical protein